MKQEDNKRNVKSEDLLPNIRLMQAKELWEQLGCIPINENEELEVSFLHFEAGDDILDVWHWFESEFDCSVAKDLMFQAES